MSITYHNTQIMTLAFNQTDAQTATYNDVLVFQKNGVVDIYNSFNISAFSVAPPPYDENGNNYDTPAPLDEMEKTISLGDVTNYNYITFKWNNENSYVPYGSVTATATINDTTVTLFNGSGYSKANTKIDVSNLSGVYSIKFKVSAKSSSTYRGYSCRSVLNVEKVCGIVGSGEPTPGVTFEDFKIGPATSFAPPPYSEGGYNIYGNNGLPAYAYHTIDLGDVTNYNTLSFTWDTWNTADPTTGDKAGSGYLSRIAAWYEDPNTSQKVYLYDDTSHNSSNRLTDSASIDLSQLSGLKSVTITIGAYSGNDYRYYGASNVLYVTSILMS